MIIPESIYGLIQLAVSILTGLYIFVFCIKSFSVITKNINSIKELKGNNKSVSIFVSALLLGLTIMVRTTVPPVITTIKITFENKLFLFTDIVSLLLRIISFYITASAFAFIIIWLAVKLFVLFTQDIDEIAEIRDGNSAISVILASLIVAISLILSTPLKILLKGIATFAKNSGGEYYEPIINTGIFIEGLISTGLAIFGSIMIFYLSFKFFTFLTKNAGDLSELKKNNNSIAVLISGFIFSIMIIVRAAIAPAQNIISAYFVSQNNDISHLMFVFSIILSFFVIGGLFSFVVLWSSMNIFFLISRSSVEIDSILKKNLAVSIVLTFLIVSLSLLLEGSITTILNGIATVLKLI